MITTKSQRFKTGIETLRKVGGVGFDLPLNNLEKTAPDLARLTVEFCYGDIISRQELDLPTRQLCTVAALAAMANAQPQLRYHIAGALNIGCPPDAVMEIMLLCAVFAGFPAAENGVAAAKEIFDVQERIFQPVPFTPTGDRYEQGFTAIEELSAGAGKSVTQSLMAISPDLSRFVVEFSYGDVLSRTVIDNRTKELAIIAMLTAMGTAAPQLKVHINAALNVGVTENEIIEIIQQMAIYAGFPAALNGVFTAQAVFSEAAGKPEKNRQ